MIPDSNIACISTLYGDFAIDLVCDQKIAKSLQRGHHQIETLELLRAFCTETSVVVDVGAHIGTLTIPLARWAGKTIAFEPAPATFALLQQNIQHNGVQVDARNKGLAQQAGNASLIGRDVGNAGSQTLLMGEGELVVGTLDDEVSHVDLLKIDAEGMELAILAGGRHCIERCRPVVLFEVNLSQLRLHGASPRAVERFFTSRGYRLYLPLPAQGGSLRLGRIRSATFITFCIAPRSWLLRTQSAPFDILAVPQEKPLPFPIASFGVVCVHAIQENLLQKVYRLKRLLLGSSSH